MSQNGFFFSKSFVRSALALCLLCCFGMVATRAAALDSINRCSRIGPDYVAVAGSNACVRLGGHVRVELNRNQLGPNSQLAPNLAPMGYAPQDGVQNAAARVAHQPVTPFALFPR